MNLYRTSFIHYSQKDSREGVWGFVLAENDGEVFDALADGPAYWENEPVEVWDEDKDEIVNVGYRDKVVAERGDYWEEVSDLYYGATQWKWELAIANCSPQDVETLKKCGLTVVTTGGMRMK